MEQWNRVLFNDGTKCKKLINNSLWEIHYSYRISDVKIFYGWQFTQSTNDSKPRKIFEILLLPSKNEHLKSSIIIW